MIAAKPPAEALLEDHPHEVDAMTADTRVAVITGAASGIGRALAVHYAKHGVRSVIGTFPGDPHDRRKPCAW